MTYTELYPALIERNLVQTRSPPLVPDKLPWWCKADMSCPFHQGAPGHDLEHCIALKAEVQRLVRANLPILCIFPKAMCHTPKFSLLLLKTFHTSILKDSSRVDHTNPLLHSQPKLGFDNSRSRWVLNTSNDHHASSYA